LGCGVLNGEGMTPDDLKARTKKFVVDIIRFAKAIPRDHINESGICATSVTTPLWREADELTRILVRSRETAIANRQSTIHNPQ
jgi:hypothetical protein